MELKENKWLEVIAKKDCKRLDKFISDEFIEISRSQGQNLILDGRVKINGNVVNSKKIGVNRGDVIQVEIPIPKELGVEAENIPLNIVYEDDDIIVVDKVAGMVVHPAPGNYSGTLVNGILYHCGDRLSTINGVIRPGIVHRIDKDTTGLLVVAKNDKAHENLARQLEEHSINRVYYCIVHGGFAKEEGIIEGNIGRDVNDRKKMAIVKVGGKRAVTHWKVLERFGQYTLLEVSLETGRTHQIRVHMTSKGHPLVGDQVYGNIKKDLARRQMLHAAVLGFKHPSSGEYIEFKSPIPEDFKKVLIRLKK